MFFDHIKACACVGWDDADRRFVDIPRWKLSFPATKDCLFIFLQGWLDVTYLSSDSSLRLSRGNKGTLFILSKEVQREDVVQQLQDAIAEGDDDAVRRQTL